MNGVNRDALFKFLARGPANWGDLKREFPQDAKGLRKLVRGLARNGEINQSEDGRQFFLKDNADQKVFTGTLVAEDRRLVLDGLPVDSPGKHLRVGDRVEAVNLGASYRVLKILEHHDAPVVGRLVQGRRGWYVESLTPGFKGSVDVEADFPEDVTEGDTVAVTVVGNTRRGLHGRVMHVVGRRTGGTAALAADTLLASQDVPVEWPDDFPEVLEGLPKSIQPGRYKHRERLADLPLVTIDGEDARDFDDAVFCEPQKNGWRLVVAIADVAHYVRPGSPLDKEAHTRGNSVYLPDRVVPMLPEQLSNGLCSLRPREHRLAMVCDMHVSKQGELGDYRFSEATIRSWQRLTYSQVGEHIAGRLLDVEAPVVASLGAMHDCYRAMAKARDKRGGLEFDTEEVKVKLDAGEVVGIEPYVRNDAHRLIEEAMIAANVCAARFIEAADTLGMYRVHEPPTGEKLERLRQTFALAGLRWKSGALTAQGLHRSLSALADHPNRGLFEMLVLRSMQQARYGPENLGHFGLALERYMHFTSPIRRYADLVVHRVIKQSLQPEAGKSPGMDALLATGEHISMTERRAEDVERSVVDWLKCEAIRGRIGDEFEGVVMAVTEFGLFVELQGAYVQGLLHVTALGSDFYRLFESSQTLVGDRTGQTFAFGDSLRVVLEGVKPERGQVDLALVGNKSRRGGKRGGDSRRRSR